MQFLKKGLKGKTKKIGNICIVLFIACVTTIAAQNNTLQLRIASERASSIQQAYAGVPFFVEVVATGNFELPQRLTIAGLKQNNILHQQQSTQMSVVNGVRSQEKKLSYLVRFDHPQQIQLGPLEVVTAQGTVRSNVLDLTVQDASQYNPAQDEQQVNFVANKGQRGAKNVQQADEFAMWSIEKKGVYVGQAIPYKLRFYYTDPDITGVAIAPITIPKARMVPDPQVHRGTEVRNKVSYQFLEWSGVIYPQQAGALVLPRVVFEYTKPQASDHISSWGNVMGLLSGFLSREQRIAESVRVTIKPLPVYHGSSTVMGVGTISHIDFTMPVQKGAQGDPLVGTLVIDGNFDTQALTAPSLIMPQEDGKDIFKVYSSQARAQGTFPKFTQTFEYIIQGLQTGNWQIPDQAFTFFNPDLEEYQTFTTPSYAVEITPGKLPVAKPEEVEAEEMADCNPMVDATVHAVQLPWTRKTIPFVWFVLGLLAPLLWLVFGSVVLAYIYSWGRYFSQLYRLRQLRYILRKAVNREDFYGFYVALQNTLSRYADDIQKRFSESEKELWNELFAQASMLAFSSHQFENHKDILSSCYHKALTLIALLEKRIARKL